MPSRFAVIAVFLIGLLSVALYMSIDTGLRIADERDALQNDLAAANGRLKAAREGAQRATQEAQRARTELEGVLNEVPVWRDAGVPQPVRDSLCARLRCAEPRTVPAPAG